MTLKTSKQFETEINFASRERHEIGWSVSDLQANWFLNSQNLEINVKFDTRDIFIILKVISQNSEIRISREFTFTINPLEKRSLESLKQKNLSESTESS